MSERFFRALVRFYPDAIRRHHGDEILALMRTRREGARGFRIVVLWLWLVLDTARAVPSAYAHQWRRSGVARGPAFGDIRQAVRSLRRRPASSLAVILCFALGIGGVTAALSFSYGVLVRPLPFDDPASLAVLFNTAPGFTRASPSYSDFATWRARTHVFSALTAYGSTTATVYGPEGPERVEGCAITFEFFRVLGVQPALGRGPTAEEDAPRGPATVVLSHDFWQTHFAEAPAALGKTLVMDGETYTVTGVMPAGFGFPAGASFWRPMRLGSAPGPQTPAVFRMRTPGGTPNGRSPCGPSRTTCCGGGRGRSRASSSCAS